jgi:hypothetical protein
LACDFIAYNLPGEDRIVLTHAMDSSQGPDLGFGAVQGNSSLHLAGPGAQYRALVATFWSSVAVIAQLPPDLGAGTYAVTIDVAGPPACSHTTQFDVEADPLADLLFAAVSPEVAELGATVEVLNMKPGFRWIQAEHGPIDLLTLNDDVVPRPQVLSGWGTNRLQLKLPGPDVYTLQEPLQIHTLRFDDISQRVFVSLKEFDAQALLVTFVQPETVLAGEQVQLVNLWPGFSWSQAQHGIPTLLTDTHVPAPAAAQPNYISGWGTKRLVLQLPAQYPQEVGAHLRYFRFRDSEHEMPFFITVVPQPYLLRIGPLKCTETEDTASGDECRLEIKVDASPLWVPFPVQDMSDGDEVDYAFDQIFFNQVQIRLYDEDVGGPDDDDLLGSTTAFTGDYSEWRNFSWDEADYDLSVTVRPIL